MYARVQPDLVSVREKQNISTPGTFQKQLKNRCKKIIGPFLSRENFIRR